MARYIDADALANKLNDLLKDIDRDIDKARAKSKIYSEKFIEGSALQQMGIACALQEVLDAPTADVVERKKGEWISDRLVTITGGTYGVRRCSLCEAYYQDIGYGWNYCPDCGACMQKEVEE